MLRVYFHQKESHRERQRDTYISGSTLVSAHSPLKDTPKKTDTNLTIEKKTPSRLHRIITKILQYIPIINWRIIRPKEQVDYIYTWGDIPLFSSVPYIIEIDNPSIVTLYNALALRLYKPIIRFLLSQKTCHKIVCISEACREACIEVFGEGLRTKITVLPPYVKKNFGEEKETSIVRFLSIALRRTGKGINETLEAFSEIKDENIELHVIGWKEPRVEEKYAHDPRIIFHGPLPRGEIMKDILPQSDILIFPTIYESLGMVALEALAAGLGIITTDTFALGEFVEDGKNGILLENPYLQKEKVGNTHLIDPTKITARDVYEKYHLNEESIHMQFQKEIKKAIEKGLKYHESWKTESRKIFERKYSEDTWKNTFSSLFL